MGDNRTRMQSALWRQPMGKIAGLAMLLAVVVPAWGAVISPHDASSYIGQVVTVEGIAHVQFTDHGSTLFAFDVIGKNGQLMGVVPKDKAGQFKHPEYLNGKLIRMTGKLLWDRGKPRIVLTSPRQISVN
jgi:hypothetical protein